MMRRWVSAALLASMLAVPCPAEELVRLEWPDSSYDRALAGFLSSSLLPVGSLPTRPTLAERLASPPFVTGEGRVSLDLAAFDHDTAAAIRKASELTDHGRVLAWEAFVPVAEQRYFVQRYFEAGLEAMHGYLALLTDPAWIPVRLRSIISGGERRVWFHVRFVLDGVLPALERKQKIVYPPGTWFVAEHLDTAGQVIETHVTGKRPDWEWDYGLYDKDGNGAVESGGHRYGLHQNVRAPSSCYSCHEISARMSPFAEFPKPAEPAGDLQPEVLIDLSPADREIVAKLNVEKGSDQVMGQYGGLAALKIRAWRQAGTAPAWTEEYWQRLIKLAPELAR